MRRRQERFKSGNEGSEIEEQLLGKADVPKDETQPEYLPYWEAVKDARKRQFLEDKTDVPTDFTLAVMNKIEELLDAEGKVKYFTAVGTVLDKKHGVDAWFELEDGIMATIDLTTGRSKGKETTDIDFPVPSEGLKSKKYFEGYAQALAERVVEIFAQEERLVRAG